MNEPSKRSDLRTLAAAFAVCGLTTLVLLVNHPGSAAHNFTELLREEAGNRLMDGLVHGGFILTLSALIICFILLARQLGSARVPVVICLVAFCIGCAAMMASLVVDGFVIPAVAARYMDADAPEKLAVVKGLFALCGSLISFLMPMGLLFQSAAMISLGGLFATGGRRMAGIIGLVAGALIIAALIAVPAHMADHVLLGGIALHAVWYFTLGTVLYRGGLTAAA